MKLAWVGWNKICQPFEKGGLGVKDLGYFNRALLSKWVWRFIMEKDSLWAKVVHSRFRPLEWSQNGEREDGSGRARKGWWKSVVEGVEGKEGRWFWDNIEHVVGDGRDVTFWDGF